MEVNEKQPTVSVICTNYNKGSRIKSALDSFIAQKTKFPFEVIIIDDASTDISLKLIKEYSDKYPNIIKAIFNNKNIGITKTWIKACKHATGKYIARCDGDDYWVDPLKLQKQVDALEESADSSWVCTDYNIINSDGTTVSLSAFENGIVDRAYSYENLLATTGFTMPSSWLIDTQLILKVNEIIDRHATDDTFDIQLELFHKTKLTYLPFVTAAYRLGHDSVSHPSDINRAKQRNEGLLQTQIYYLDKYSDVNYKEMTKSALEAIVRIDAMLIDSNNELIIINGILKDNRSHIKEQEKLIKDIVGSKRYKLATKLAKPTSLIKLKKVRVK